MSFRVVDKGWLSEFVDALGLECSELRIICPFIKARSLDHLLSRQPGFLQVITRFNLDDFADGVSDIEALRHVLNAGGQVRGIRHLHAKLYLFGSSRAIITSANLTDSGLRLNREFGVVMENPAAIESCRAYFDELWRLGASDLQSHQIDDWDRKLNRHLSTGGRPSGSTDLKDFGVDAGIPTIPDVDASPIYTDPPQAFVKFLGEGSNRVSLSVGTIEEIEETGCHWAVAYPAAAGRRPTGVEDGALIFSSRLVKGPDIRVFGRAIGMKHKEGRDDATQTDIEQRPWKSKWPRYIRVHHAEFVAGTLQNGVSLGKLMDTLGTNSFSST